VRHRSLVIATVLGLIALLGVGCLGLSSSTTTPDGTPTLGTITGRVWTAACGGPAASSCGPTNYRGALVFCRSMNENGLCPSARVDSRGHYRIVLHGGRWAVIPAPGSGNVVFVKPRWVLVRLGQTTVLNIRGGNLTK
jgi:hypothetical protein